MLTVMDSSVIEEIKKNTDIQYIKSIHAQILHTQKFADHSNYVKLPGMKWITRHTTEPTLRVY